MSAFLRAVACHLPDRVLDNAELARRHPKWSPDAIFAKTGIRSRRIAAADETASDLGCAAAERLFEESGVDRSEIDALFFCTQSPDFFLPTTACVMQQRLGLPRTCGALDFNLGCSGFTYGLWLARAMITAKACRNVLLVMADTYSKYCGAEDLSTATIFGDAGAAALISASSAGSLGTVGPSIVGTDGRGAESLIVRCGGARMPQGEPTLFMNGPEIFSFTLSTVKSGIEQLLRALGIGWDDVDLFLFHQANRFMLEHLRLSMKIPAEKLPIDLEDTGNTVSASIPLLLRRGMDRQLFKSGQNCILVGFGVGYSWAMTSLRWGAPE